MTNFTEHLLLLLVPVQFHSVKRIIGAKVIRILWACYSHRKLLKTKWHILKVQHNFNWFRCLKCKKKNHSFSPHPIAPHGTTAIRKPTSCNVIPWGCALPINDVTMWIRMFPWELPTDPILGLCVWKKKNPSVHVRSKFIFIMFIWKYLGTSHPHRSSL